MSIGPWRGLIDSDRVGTKDLDAEKASDAMFARAWQRQFLLNGKRDSSKKPSQAKVISESELAEIRAQLDAWAGSAHTLQRGKEARSMAGIRKRSDKVKELKRVHRAPGVPPLTMTMNDWVGTDTLTSWSGYGGSGKGKVDINISRPWDDEDDENPVEPATEMLDAYRHLKANETAIRTAVLQAVQTYINDTLNGQYKWGLKPIVDVSQLKPQMKIDTVHLLSYAKDGLAYIGLFFQCDWDEEHACGVLVHGSRVVGVGDNENGQRLGHSGKRWRRHPHKVEASIGGLVAIVNCCGVG